MRDDLQKKDIRRQIEEHERKILEQAMDKSNKDEEKEREGYLRKRGFWDFAGGSDGGSAADGGAA